jgi:16S rRNA (uracil1498-N3)-methyltransferase
MTPRCFVDPSQWEHPTVVLSREDSHHLTDVLRSGLADRVVVSNGIGGEAAAEITSMGPQGVTVRILDRACRPGDEVLLTLIQAVPKAQKMDWIIQKATEIGVWSILPVMTDRGVVKLEEDRADKRAGRWQRIAVEAAKQCRTAWIPVVQPVQPLTAVLAGKLPVEVLLIASLEEGAVPLRQYLGELRGRKPRSIGLLIGPEGDFTPREAERAREAGAIPVSYGGRVLRVETAAIYGLCALAYEWSAI